MAHDGGSEHPGHTGGQADGQPENIVIRIWDTVEDWLLGVLSAAALLLICYEVVVRYFFPQYLTDWGSEFTIYFTVWAMLIAGSSLVKTARHIRADLVVRVLPEKIQIVLEFFNLLIGMVYCGLVAKYGFDVTMFARNLDERSESSMQFPLWIFYIALPLAFGLMSIRYLIRIKDFIFHFDPETMLARSDEERLEESQT